MKSHQIDACTPIAASEKAFKSNFYRVYSLATGVDRLDVDLMTKPHLQKADERLYICIAKFLAGLGPFTKD